MGRVVIFAGLIHLLRTRGTHAVVAALLVTAACSSDVTSVRQEQRYNLVSISADTSAKSLPADGGFSHVRLSGSLVLREDGTYESSGRALVSRRPPGGEQTDSISSGRSYGTYRLTSDLLILKLPSGTESRMDRVGDGFEGCGPPADGPGQAICHFHRYEPDEMSR